ncbi:MAG: 2-hydroxy-6-oxonona-2,4-dienedioate hydrolase [Gammaproteobacteria bacterium]|jgi:2-hydroxy-6-oxonona-2,4-dienedioate hydrolase|nr:2-hydroxy-6-oxonona-2,4-dienedioate hydrolase [Gammaproteobacteria bacterium]
MNRVAFSHRWIDVGGLPTRLVEAGDGPETVVFLHGIGGHLETFCLNIAAHAQRHRVVAFDLLGHGYTAKPDGIYEIERYVDHTLRFLDLMGIDKATLAGTSLGGWISARIAARHPERVTRLSLISSAGLTSHPSVMHQLKTLTERASLTSGREAVKLRLEFVLKNPAAMTEELIDIRHDIYSAPDYQKSVRNIMCLQDMEIRRRNLLTDDELAKIKAPTLVVWTHDDPTATLSDGRKYADAIADSRFVVFENSAHMPQLEEPERFNALHLAFMADPKSIEPTVDPLARSDAAADKLTEKTQ